MRPGATYKPLVNPNPVLSIDLVTGMVRRYVRVVPAAGMRQQPRLTHTWSAAAEGREFDRRDTDFDITGLHQIRLTGHTWEE